MFLKKISIQNFRNYRQASLDCLSPINIFIGDNGQGKSSFLEAIYCALRGQSFHSFIQDQFVQKNKKNSKVSLVLQEMEGLSQIESAFFYEGSHLKKEIYYCGKKVSSSFLIKKFPCFVFTESSLKCIRQGPAERRNFVEEFFYSDQELKIKQQFYKALKQKKQLLKNYKKGLIPKPEFLTFLAVTNKTFLTASYELVKARLRVLNQIFSKNLAPSFFGTPAPCLEFSYLIKDSVKNESSENILLLLKKDMESKYNTEIESGLPLSGPQKHEIVFLFNGEDSRSFCSKGQQRSYILSLLLSYIQEIPQAFLFLDDVLLELDDSVQKKVLKFLEKNHCQIFLTNCSMVSFRTENMTIFSVKNGTLEKYG